MQSLLQAKHRQTSIIKCFRYNLYITGSHYGDGSLILQKYGRGVVIDICQIRSDQNLKIGSGKSESGCPNPKSRYPPPPLRSCGSQKGGLSEGAFSVGAVVFGLSSSWKASWISHNWPFNWSYKSNYIHIYVNSCLSRDNHSNYSNKVSCPLIP